MDQHQASVNQVKGCIGKRIGHDVMATYLQIRKLRTVEETRIEIRYQDMSRGANASGEPSGDCASAAAYLQAIPAGSDPAVLQVPYAFAVIEGRQSVESFGRLRGCIVEQVGRYGLRLELLTLRGLSCSLLYACACRTHRGFALDRNPTQVGDLLRARATSKCRSMPGPKTIKATPPAEWASCAAWLAPGITLERVVVIKAAETPNRSTADVGSETFAGGSETSGIDSGQIVSPETMESVEKHGGKENSQMKQWQSSGRRKEIKEGINDQRGNDKEQRAAALRNDWMTKTAKSMRPAVPPNSWYICTPLAICST